MGDRLRLAIVGVLVVASAAVYLALGLSGNWAYALNRRSIALATLIVVSVAIGVATVLFQTVTHNQILTPSVMGFDSLYLLIQTAGALLVGGVLADSIGLFLGQVVVMVALSMLLYTWLLAKLERSIHVLVLIGIVIGIFFRSISAFLQRIMDPTLFVVLQDRFFASFTGARPALLVTTSVIVVACLVWVAPKFRTLDVLHLGRDMSISLGVRHRRIVLEILCVCTVLVSVSTALVGPTTFFGLLVAHLGYRLVRHQVHRYTVPAAAGCAMVVLIVGQVILERVLNFESSLSIVVEFAGGIVFLVLLLRRPAT